MGDDSDFPSLHDPENKNAPVKPKVTLVTAVKQMVSKHNHEDFRRQSRQANITIHRVMEITEATGQEQKDKDMETVKTILETIQWTQQQSRYSDSTDTRKQMKVGVKAPVPWKSSLIAQKSNKMLWTVRETCKTPQITCGKSITATTSLMNVCNKMS